MQHLCFLLFPSLSSLQGSLSYMFSFLSSICIISPPLAPFLVLFISVTVAAVTAVTFSLGVDAAHHPSSLLIVILL